MVFDLEKKYFFVRFHALMLTCHLPKRFCTNLQKNIIALLNIPYFLFLFNSARTIETFASIKNIVSPKIIHLIKYILNYFFFNLQSRFAMHVTENRVSPKFEFFLRLHFFLHLSSGCGWVPYKKGSQRNSCEGLGMISEQSCAADCGR